MDNNDFQDDYIFGTFLNDFEGAEGLYDAGSGQTYVSTVPQFDNDVERAQKHEVRPSPAIVCLPC